jgi:Zn-dependent peptidase ImmA (M78 family)/transcriptional regulator with XRE-family HTH domain
MVGQFNRAMLSLARASRGFTQSELAKAANVTQALISKLESGLTVDPSDETVDAIAKALRFPVEFFFSDERAHGMPQFHYRKRAKLGRKALDTIEAKINIRRIHAARLFKSYELHAERFPAIDLENVGWSPQQAAQHIRGLWMIPRGPLDNLTTVVEDNGAVVIQIDFGTSLLDAMSFRIPGLPPLIFMNKDMPGERYRFTLAHELAHLLLHNQPESDENMETQADEFAGELLMPAKEIRPYLTSPSLGSLARVKPYWKVSIKALCMQCIKLKMITPNQYTGLMVNYSKARYGRFGEPFPIPVETPSALGSAVAYHMKTLNYTPQEMASLLMIETNEFQEMYSATSPSKQPHLRIIN